LDEAINLHDGNAIIAVNNQLFSYL